MRTAPEQLSRVVTVRPAGESSAIAAMSYRAIDFALALVLSLVLLPVIAIVALALRIEGKGPVMVRERRLGLDFEPFTLHAFRTSRPAARAERRAGKVERVIARLRLECLPHLWDVLRGRMSIVGPAPAQPDDIPRYTALPWPAHWVLRFAVKPGITGLAQVSRHREAWTLAEMVELDVDYVCGRSLWLNLAILARTPIKLADPRRATP